MSAKPKANQLRLIRLYDAPLKLVWEAWTDPKKAAKWWGPRGYTITTHSKDLRAGGTWNYTMHGPDGTDYPNITKYHEVEPYTKLTYDHGANLTQPPLFHVEALFSESNGQTKMQMTMTMATPEAAIEIGKFVKKAGGNATWDRLGEFLAAETHGKNQFIINRSFAAPVQTMFEMWTNPDHLSKWLAPKGSEMEFIRVDIKPGGGAFYSMSGPDNSKMFGRTSYLKIDPPNLIVYTQQFCDELETITRHPLAPTWPEAMLTTVRLSEEGPDQTRVTVTWEPHGQTTADELEIFINARSDMTLGWTGSFDKLEDYLTGHLN